MNLEKQSAMISEQRMAAVLSVSSADSLRTECRRPEVWRPRLSDGGDRRGVSDWSCQADSSSADGRSLKLQSLTLLARPNMNASIVQARSAMSEPLAILARMECSLAETLCLDRRLVMPIDYPPELICTASCNNLDCSAQVRVECQHGDFQADVETKLRRRGWIVEGDAVYCSQGCLMLDVVAAEVAGGC